MLQREVKKLNSTVIMPIDKFVHAVSICHNLALIVSQCTADQFVVRIKILAQLERCWLKGCNVTLQPQPDLGEEKDEKWGDVWEMKPDVEPMKDIDMPDMDQKQSLAKNARTMANGGPEDVTDKTNEMDEYEPKYDECHNNDHSYVLTSVKRKRKLAFNPMSRPRKRVVRRKTPNVKKSEFHQSLVDKARQGQALVEDKPLSSINELSSQADSFFFSEDVPSACHTTDVRDVTRPTPSHVDYMEELSRDVNIKEEELSCDLNFEEGELLLEVNMEEEVELSYDLDNEPEQEVAVIEGAATVEMDVKTAVTMKSGATTKHSMKSNTCKVCQERFDSKPALRRHMPSHRDANTSKYTCTQCSYQSKYKCTLIRHMRIHTGEKPFACLLCCYRSSASNGLSAHMRTHAGEKPFACHLCPLQFTQAGNLSNHMSTHTSEKKFECTECSYKTNCPRYLIDHKRTHTGEKPFLCTFCSFQCRRTDHLKNHMRTHTGEKPFLCSHCSYRSKDNSGLRSHMRSHMGEKPFACTLCSYRCKLSSSIRIHMRTHSGEKPFECTLCSYRCKDNGSLKSHMRTHTGEKRFECTICSYRCSQSDNLSKHMLTHARSETCE